MSSPLQRYHLHQTRQVGECNTTDFFNLREAFTHNCPVSPQDLLGFLESALVCQGAPKLPVEGAEQ